MKLKLTSEAIERYQSMLDFMEYEAYERLTPWQRNFVGSVRLQLLNDKALSKKQVDQIDHIFEKVVERDTRSPGWSDF